MQSGHSGVFDYGWRFFLVALEAMKDKRENDIIDRAVAHRASKMDQKDFMEFTGQKPMSHDEIYEKHQADAL